MVKNHTKRMAMPTSWTTQQKKGIKWVANARPGAHSKEEGMPLVLVLREVLKYANTAREAKHILNHKNVLVDGVRRKDHRFMVGLMDTVSLPDVKEYYRILLKENGKLELVKIDEKEATTKVCKINGKGQSEKKTQLRLSDGRTILVEKGEYKTADSVVINVPDQKITSHLKFEKGALVLITAGKRIGNIGTVAEIKGDVVKIASKDGDYETLKKYCYVVGKQKPIITIE
jgi:small subunit ribosomal protein S4e